MLESIQNENLEYQRLSPDEMKARGILGRLVGVCADFTNPTRNGRLYSEELWEKVFNDPIMKERIQNGVCYGELGHPEDREETDMEKIAVCLSSVPKKGSDGKLRAVFDILDTPNGRILKSLCDYGSTLGISSRGSGDLVTGFNGQEEVDPSSYNCEGFDVVLIPAVKEARLQYVTESLNKKRYNKTLRQKLQESLDSASPSDRKVMQEGLNTIGISLNESNKYDSNNSKIGDDIYTNAEVIGEQLQKTDDETRKQRIESEIEEYEKDADWAEDHNNPGGATQARKKISDLRESSGLSEQAFPRKVIVDKCQELGSQFISHFDKIYNENDEETISHHASEMQAWLDTVRRYKWAHNNRALSTVDILNLFTTQGGDYDDVFPNNAIEAEVYESFCDELVKDWNVKEALRRVELLGELTEAKYTRKELIDKFGTDDLDIINAGNEEQVDMAVENNEAEIIQELQESIKTIKALKQQVLELQEKLSVCYSKEADQEDEINSLKGNISSLTKVNESNEALKNRVRSLTEKLNKEKDSSSNKDQSNIKLKESLNSVVGKYNRLVDVHNELKESYQSINSQYNILEKELNKTKQDNEKLKEEYASKLSNSNALIEKYKKAATSAAERYIDSQAVRIGVSSREIKNKLPEKYTFKDIDSICEQLSNYNLNISKLPFSVSRIMNEDVKIDTASSKESILPDDRFDDDVDDLLKRLSGM